MKKTGPDIIISSNELSKLTSDPIASAKAVKLVYVSSAMEGITRTKNGKGFIYLFRSKRINDKKTLERIRSLVLPPAWKDVWICTLENGHLQATGKDAMDRKQYRYHPMWNECRNMTKFFRLIELGNALPKIREQVRTDLALPGLPRQKVLATVISLMERTGIRIGSEFYKKLYGSFGLTTLKDDHVDIKSGVIKFCFRGKKGVEHELSLRSKKLARIVQHCKDIPGKELFQYIDEEGKRQSIDSGMVNEYIQEIAASEFTAKDLRTWCGSVAGLVALKEAGSFADEKEAKRKVVEALDKVSEQLGNSRTICKKYYVHPTLTELYESGKLEKWIAKLQRAKRSFKNGLLPEEKVLMEILKKG